MKNNNATIAVNECEESSGFWYCENEHIDTSLSKCLKKGTFEKRNFRITLRILGHLSMM